MASISCRILGRQHHQGAVLVRGHPLACTYLRLAVLLSIGGVDEVVVFAVEVVEDLKGRLLAAFAVPCFVGLSGFHRTQT